MADQQPKSEPVAKIRTPVLQPQEATILQAAATVLDNIEERGFVDFSDVTGGYGVEHTAANLRRLVETLTDVLEAP